jgi:hypothetical protein
MMTATIIGCLLGSLALEVGILYHMLEQEFKNKMDEIEETDNPLFLIHSLY